MNPANIFLSSDHHFGHANILRYCNRPFKDVHHMNVEMTRRWNEVVPPDGLVYYLGDFAMAPQVMEKVLPMLHGRKILIAGNHDLLPGKKLQRHERYAQAGWEKIVFEEKIPLVLHGKSCIIKLHHMPYAPSEEEQAQYDVRYLDLRPKDEGEDYLFHGHVHQHWLQKGKCFNVGVDVHDFRPISIADIEKVLVPYV